MTQFKRTPKPMENLKREIKYHTVILKNISNVITERKILAFIKTFFRK